MSLIKVKTRLTTLGFDKSQKYVTSPVRYSNISVDDLINYASENSGMSKANISAAFYAIAQQIEQFVCNGHGIVLGHLGTFYISTRSKAADDAKDAGANAVRSLAVRFRQSKKLRVLLNNNTTLQGVDFEKDDEDEETTDTSGGGSEDTQGSGDGQTDGGTGGSTGGGSDDDSIG